MMRLGSGTRAVSLAAMMLVGVSLAGCGDDAGSAVSGQTANATGTTYPINRAPGSPATPTASIAGVPVATATAGQPYSFQPSVTNTTGDTVTFTITNLPVWAKFNATTGLLSGTPTATQVGKYAGIAIALVDGKTTSVLPAFTVTVAATGSSDAVTLSWEAPTANQDGSPLVDLKGYNVHYGSASKAYSETIQITNAGLTTYVVQNLAAGHYFFAITAYNSAGQESSLSPEVSTMVN